MAEVFAPGTISWKVNLLAVAKNRVGGEQIVEGLQSNVDQLELDVRARGLTSHSGTARCCPPNDRSPNFLHYIQYVFNLTTVKKLQIPGAGWNLLVLGFFQSFLRDGHCTLLGSEDLREALVGDGDGEHGLAAVRPPEKGQERVGGRRQGERISSPSIE
eukprot:GHVT01089741.1.p1 GENE.GHVT01089741.1~~GHVT01089741.1.p1  ORF type:complete len:159 (-),score=25.87 GHVT01089741.1:292-768(-)